MRILGDSSEDELVFEFLAAELDSRLFREGVGNCLKLVGARRSLLQVPNFGNPTSNVLRKRVLSCYRGYGRNDLLFRGFPADAKWVLVEVNMDELGGFYYAKPMTGSPYPTVHGSFVTARNMPRRCARVKTSGRTSPASRSA
jgi:hypothetical protein